MFMLSFSVFIGGRFIANVLGYEGDVFSPSPLKLKSRFRYEKIYFITTF